MFSCALTSFLLLNGSPPAEPSSKCSFAKLSCCSRMSVICSIVQPKPVSVITSIQYQFQLNELRNLCPSEPFDLNLPKALSLPDWKSSSKPSKARSMCLTSGTSVIKEWCFNERVSKPEFDCASKLVSSSTNQIKKKTKGKTERKRTKTKYKINKT